MHPAASRVQSLEPGSLSIMIPAPLVHALEKITPVRLEERLSRHTTIGIGGPADVYVVASSGDELRGTLSACYEAGVPVFMLGSGSNIVVGDRGIRGVTIENNANS